MGSQALLGRARSGDEAAFAELVAPHRRELHVHCYRMLGSFDDADDALQETLLGAWRGLATFRGNASLRTWLYRIATNTCLNLIRTASRRPQMTEPLPAAAPPPSGSNEVTWLQPYPDTLLDGLPAAGPGPEAQIERHEAVSLAFVTALQLLSPRARAVLVLRDVLGFAARETAAILGGREEAIAMTLSRARASLREHQPSAGAPPARPGRLHPRPGQRAVAGQRTARPHPARRADRRAHPLRIAHPAPLRPAPHPAGRPATMTNRMTPLLEHNEQFARTFTPVPLGLPTAQVILITCLDHRVD